MYASFPPISSPSIPPFESHDMFREQKQMSCSSNMSKDLKSHPIREALTPKWCRCQLCTRSSRESVFNRRAEDCEEGAQGEPAEEALKA